MAMWTLCRLSCVGKWAAEHQYSQLIFLSSLRDLLLQDEVVVQCSEEGRKITEGLCTWWLKTSEVSRN